jgi:hypothetical protein
MKETRNIETFKTGANRVNEFEFHKHQVEMAQHRGGKQPDGAGATQTKAERVQEVIKQAHEKVARRKKRR